jgi:hypothetical protein
MNGDYVVEGPADARPADGGARLRVGIIGLGIGRMHIDGWRQHPQADVVAIADTDAARLAKVGDSHAIELPATPIRWPCWRPSGWTWSASACPTSSTCR